MLDSETLIEAIRTYLTIRIGQASLSPAATVIFVVTLAAALLCALHLWRIGRQEERLRSGRRRTRKLVEN